LKKPPESQPGLGLNARGDIGHARLGGGLSEIKRLKFQVHGADISDKS
jgi:hypothetical protein